MKNYVFVIVFLVVIAAGFFTGCKMGNHNVTSQERIAEGFNSVSLNGAGNVNIYSGQNYRLVVTTDSNLQDRVETNVNGNTLLISQKNLDFSATELTVDVYLPELKSITLHGAGNCLVNTGNTSALDLSLSGAGDIDAQNYEVQNITINHSGAGTAKIWATNTLNGSLKGVGKILYKGSPAMDINISGVGKINPM